MPNWNFQFAALIFMQLFLGVSRLVDVEITQIGHLIYVIRGQRVMLDRDLAALYGVPTKSLNLSVRRNALRFPADFMFVLTKEEAVSLRFQIETSKKGRGGLRYLPLAFTEQGVAMLSSVLRSERAVRANIEIMRAFVNTRRALGIDKELAERMAKAEKKLGEHEGHIGNLFEEIEALSNPPTGPRRNIGFSGER